MAFGRGPWGPISDTFSEITNIIQRDADRKNRHEEAMANLAMQNKQMEANFAHQRRIQAIEDYKVAQAEQQMAPTGINLRAFMDPGGDPYNVAHVSELSDKLLNVLGDGKDLKWDADLNLVNSADGSPVEMPAFEAQRRMAGAFGVMLAYTDPYKSKERDMFKLQDQLEEHEATKPMEKGAQYKQGEFPRMMLEWKQKKADMQNQFNTLQAQSQDPKHMKQEYIAKLGEIEEMRAQLIAIGASQRVTGFLGEAADRYEKMLGDIDKKIQGGKGSTDFERAYAQWLSTPASTNPKTGNKFGRWYFKNNIWNTNEKKKETLKERNYTEWRKDPENKDKTMMDFEREYKKFTSAGVGEGQALKIMSDESFMYDIKNSPYKDVVIDGQPLTNEHLNQLWQRGLEALTTQDPNMTNLQAMNRVKTAQPMQLPDGSIWLIMEDGQGIWVK